MHHLFRRMTQKYARPMNRLLMEGLAVDSFKHLEEYLDLQIKSICQGMPECFKYEGYERCSSQEEYMEITRLRSTRRTFDLGMSHVYLIKLFFSFIDQVGNQHQLTRYVYLPFVSRGGILSISGSKYHLVPVISDKVFTSSRESVFVRLTQDRNNFFRMYHSVTVDDKYEARNVAWARIYRSPDAKKSSAVKKTKTTLVHYLLGKYGFDEAFLRYAGYVPEVGNAQIINRENYPEKDWIIYESIRRKPIACRDMHYQPSTTRLAVRRKRFSNELEALVFGFFYVVDHFPERLEPAGAFREIIDDDGVISKERYERTPEEHQKLLKSYLNDKSLWKILIGLIIFTEPKSENIIYKDISEHFISLNSYLDHASQEKLAGNGIRLDDYYDLLAYLAAHFNEMVQENADSGQVVYGKNLEISSCVLYDILFNMTSMKFALNRAASRRPLTLKDITANLLQFVKMGKIFEIHTGKILTQSVSYSGDHLYPGITALLAEQENRAGAARGKTKRTVVGPQHRIDLSMLSVGSVLNLPKANPTPLARVNPWAVIDPVTGTILPNPKIEKLIEENREFFKF